MKLFKNIYLVIASFSILVMACDPIEDRDLLKNAFSPDDIEMAVEHSAPGSNLFTLKLKTPGVTGYWDYTIGKGFSNEVEVLYPITGTQTFSYVVSSGYIGNNMNDIEYVVKSIDVEITQLDNEVPEQWGNLVGDGSKTWVFDKSDITRWWYMTDADPAAFWWQPDDGPSDETGRMVFDLEGQPNFTYYASPDAEPVGNTTWVFNSDFSELRLIGEANILGVEDGGVHVDGLKNYRILELTEDRLVLFNTPVAWSPGWVWVFKPAED
ncbi:hypothetical protein [Alkalitalea saponilacus]|uniref:Uncharacterized protein n=1 Tax=Alkalitalea saponilacus TaxID=889453 RepID=A0A1T5HTQ3_9BACT|nr:hypothetical protein [Alkalitalea saponilacus]ASB49971.1 hypothetical protein CDL62_12910 [Alkalitalea saponilacus]SKC24075.1 hypothetical protein SAMN03080601_03367 [Alkalitalea saponilacus]